MQTAGFFQLTVVEAEDQNAIVYPPHQIQKTSNPSETSPKEKKKIALTEGQKEVWVEHRLGREAAAAYNLAGELPIQGPFDITCLQKAAQNLVNRHQALRSHFDKDTLSQTILPTLELEIPFIDLSTLEHAESLEKLETLRLQEVEIAFDLFSGPLFRLSIVRLAEEDHRILMTAHHGISDGWSCGILAQELGALYTAAWEGKTAQLPAVKSLETYVREQEIYQQSEDYAAAEAFWLSQFAEGIPVLDLPTDHSRPLVKTYQAAQESFLLDEALVKQLRQLAARQSTTFFVLMYTAFQTFLHRLSGQEDFVLGLVAAAQSVAGNQNLVAHGVSLLPLRCRLDKKASFSSQLRQSRNQVLDAFEHQQYTLGTLVKQLKNETGCQSAATDFRFVQYGRRLRRDSLWASPGTYPTHSTALRNL